MPAPPPPPPMAPAAPPPPMFKAPKGGPDDRDALLKSIRKGAKLKKAVTNDRSAPLVSGTSSNNRAVNNTDNSSNSSVSSAKNFSSIHMELKRQLGGDNDSPANNVISPMRNFNSIQMELKKQLANDNRNRGPPPPAPNRNLPDVNFQKRNLTSKENGPNGIHLSQLSLNTNSNLQVNPSMLHRKAKSNANLSSLESGDDTNGFQPTKPVINHGKPNLAPKPPVLNGKPFLTPKSSNSNNKPSLGRAHSMKNAPRSPSPQGSVDAMNPSIKFGTVRHMSSVLSQALSTSPGQPQPVRSRPALNGRPTAPPPSVPQQPPPPVPSYPSSPSQPAPPPPSKTSIGVVKHPNHAPPPPPPTAPPVAPPPPPPHKTLHMPARQQAPSVPPSMSIPANPPPPPPRHSSMRENPSVTNMTVDLEEKFKHLFKTVDKFPHPPPYRNVTKLYERPTKKPNYVV